MTEVVLQLENGFITVEGISVKRWKQAKEYNDLVKFQGNTIEGSSIVGIYERVDEE